MKRSRLIAAAAITAALAAGTAGAAYAVTAQSSVRLPNACVKYGEPDSILGNYMLWNWNNSTSCPGGTYAVYFPQSVVTVTAPPATATTTATATATATVTATATSTSTVTASPTATSVAENAVLTVGEALTNDQLAVSLPIPGGYMLSSVDSVADITGGFTAHFTTVITDPATGKATLTFTGVIPIAGDQLSIDYTVVPV
jgi:hypothetical protein